MSKPILVGLDFDFTAPLVKPKIAAEEVGALSVNPAGALTFDANGVSPSNKVHFNDGTKWLEILDRSIISADSNFSNDADSIATRNAIRQYVEATVAGVGSFKGSFDASGGSAPTGVGIMAGDYYRATTSGILTGIEGGEIIQVGDIIVASIDNPAGNADYFVLQANFTDARDVAVGGTFTPTAGVITGTSSVKEALEFLKNDITQAGSQDLQSVMDNGSFASGIENGSIEVNNFFEIGADGGKAVFSVLNSGISLQRNTFDGTFGINIGFPSIVVTNSYGQGISYGASGDYLSANPLTLMPKAYIDNLVGGIKSAFTITGDGTATSFTVTHNKGTKEVIVQVWEVATDELVEVAVTLTDTNTASIAFATAPANAAAYRVVVL